jgi:7-cyano-7-deazaguanine synthase
VKKAVILLSGGLDSATALYFARGKGFRCFCLLFDYGQRHKREIEAAVRIVRLTGSSYKIVKISLPWQGGALLDKRIALLSSVKVSKCPATKASAGRQSVKEVPGTYVPGRNIIFLSFALSYAEAIGAEAIFIGAHIQDYSGYPDCRPQFYRSFNRVISAGTKAGVEKRGIKVETQIGRASCRERV